MSLGREMEDSHENDKKNAVDEDENCRKSVDRQASRYWGGNRWVDYEKIELKIVSKDTSHSKS